MTAASSVPWTSGGLLECSGGRLRYSEVGAGPVVVMLPKLGGWIADWRHVTPSLAADHRVIAMDPPGHGGSVMAGAPPYLQTVPESAAAILAALDTLGVERFSLVGNSLGGCIGIAIAALWPKRVARLALVSVSLAPKMSLAALAAGDAALRGFGPDGAPLPRTAMELARFGPISEAVVAEQNLSRAAAGLWLRPSERGVGRMGMPDYLPRIEAPTLVVNGAQSHYSQYEAVARRLIRDVRCVTIPDSGPFVHQEHPAATVAHLAPFLADAR